MPVTTKLFCPECDAELIRRPAGRCPNCGEDVRDHVLQARAREKRIEQIVAVVSTLLVLAVSLFVGGCSIVEGITAYAIAGAAMWAFAKRTMT
ncbi:MAG TPA: hypothetical protein VEB21_15565 [Terriglobales bacterium]|nr:hypothetical protein [Terriglobales bacterium]